MYWLCQGTKDRKIGKCFNYEHTSTLSTCLKQTRHLLGGFSCAFVFRSWINSHSAVSPTGIHWVYGQDCWYEAVNKMEMWNFTAYGLKCAVNDGCWDW